MIPFTKAHGNGNDFVIFQAGQCPPTIRDGSFLQRVGDRRTGVGCDGFLIISDDGDPAVDFLLDYHNSDGGWETFCANGTRCAAKYFLRATGRTGPLTIRTGAGIHTVDALPDGTLQLQILPPSHVGADIEVCGYKGRHVDSGAPHFTVQVDDLSLDMAAADGPRIRHAGIFKPRGVNVNFFRPIDRHTLSVITFEKGVEAVTLSCASGSSAVAFEAASLGLVDSPVRIINPGGELTVTFDAAWQNVTVAGPAVLVYDSALPADF